MLGLSAASVVVLLRPERAASSVRFGLGELAVALAALVALMLGVTVLHELAHGVAMSAVMRERPVFGVRPLYAYAAAPEWYFPRRPL